MLTYDCVCATACGASLSSSTGSSTSPTDSAPTTSLTGIPASRAMGSPDGRCLREAVTSTTRRSGSWLGEARGEGLRFGLTTPSRPLRARSLGEILNVGLINAPREADSQLAFLEQQKITVATISHDIDMLALGSRFLIHPSSLRRDDLRVLDASSLRDIVRSFRRARGEPGRKIDTTTQLLFCTMVGNGMR